MKGLLKRMLKYKFQILLGVIALLLVDLAQLVIPLIVRRAVDLLRAGNATTSILLRFGLYILGLAIFIAIFRFFWRYFIMGTARKVERDVRNELYFHLLKLSANFFNKERTGEIMAHATNDANAIRMAVGMGVVALSDTFIYSIFSLGAMISISPTLTLYTVIPLPILAIFMLSFGKLIYKLFEDVQKTFSTMTESVREAITGIRVIKGFAQEKGQLYDFEKINSSFVVKNLKLVKVWGAFQPVINLFASFSIALLLFVGGRKVILNEISLGDFVAFSSYLGMMIWPMIAIGWVTNLLQRGAASMDRIERILKTEPDIKSPPHPRKVKVEGNICVRNLTFGYTPNKPVVYDIDFEIKRGEKLGILGRTGSGKSTIVYLIPRIFDPPEGSIFIDGIDVRSMYLEDLRKSISLVPQESILFSTTIKENLTYGNPDAHEDEIINALKIAEIYDEIMEMPHGLDTQVGERGVTLSGGQRQRLAIARAILRNAPIFILDDALSAVDAETESRILKNLSDFLKTKTTIIISHRVSALKDCNHILVLDRGKIVDRGTHEELISREGIYKHIYEMQKLEEEVAG